MSLRHPLGTDVYGRDQLSRLIHAGRVDLLVALSATAIALTLGSTLGAVAGYRGGWVDQLVMRGVDAVMAFPAFILAMAITAALGNSIANVVAAIAITHVPIYTRLIRGEMLKARETEYAEAARTVGDRPHQIVLYHLLPNCVPPLVVQATLAMGFAILTVAALSFIGLGIQPPAERVGADDGGGRRLRGVRRVVARALPRVRHHADRARLQPGGRQPARPPRSARCGACGDRSCWTSAT